MCWEVKKLVNNFKAENFSQIAMRSNPVFFFFLHTNAFFEKLLMAKFCITLIVEGIFNKIYSSVEIPFIFLFGPNLVIAYWFNVV